MIKIENEKINVYCKLNKKEFITSLIMFIGGTALLILVIAFMITRIDLKIICIIFDIIIISAGIFFIKYLNSKENSEKLFCTLDKECFIHYKNNLKIPTEKIQNFTVIRDYNSVAINYINDNNKKSTKIFALRGASNSEFVNLSNEFLNNKISLEENIIDNCNDSGNDESNNNIEKKLIDEGKVIKCIVIGKTKSFKLVSDKYSLENLYSEIVFWDQSKNTFSFSVKELIIDWNNISLDNYYEIFYNKKMGKFEVKKLDEFHMIDSVQEYRDNAINSAKLVYDKNQINVEVKMLNELNKLYSTIMILCLLLIVVSAVTKKMVIFVGGFTIMVFLFLPVMMLCIISKYKKQLKI